MTQQILNYVTTTPCNSNRAVLQSLLKGLKVDNNGELISFLIAPTITGEPGTNAEVVNIGTKDEPVLQFTIPRGENGYIPEIGENENWFINGIDTGKPSRGKDGEFNTVSNSDIDVLFN